MVAEHISYHTPWLHLFQVPSFSYQHAAASTTWATSLKLLLAWLLVSISRKPVDQVGKWPAEGAMGPLPIFSTGVAK
jgi:hypothetical protein